MTETVNAVEKDYQVGDQAEKWAEGVLSQIRRQTVSIKMQSRVQYTSGLSCDTRLRSTKKVVIYPMGEKPEESYLGPAETYHGRQEEK